MRTLRHFSLGLLIAATGAALIPATTRAQNCDYQVVSATWHPHSDPSMIYVDFSVDVSTNFPVSADTTRPSEFPVQVNIRFNGAPMVAPQDLVMLWWQSLNNCSNPACPAGVVCEVKQWQFKTTLFRDQSLCARNGAGVCGCPPLGTPVVEHKPVPKPPGPGTIEIELVPLSLQSCNPINPQNDKKQFNYPGGSGGGVPAANRALTLVLAAALLASGMVALRRGARGGIA